MSRKTSGTKLHNVLFPFWMIMMFPIAWLVILPGNFIIDSLVLLISMAALKITDRKLCYKKYIFKIFTFGMLSDIIGAAYLMLMMLVFEVGVMGDELYLTLPALFISAVLIFILNYYVTFKNVDKPLRLKMSVIFSTVTAPYTFLVPSSWLYG